MTKKIIYRRIRHYIPAEGESDQSFIKWLQQLADQEGLHVHLDCKPLDGGGYKTMLEEAILHQKRKERYKAKSATLLVDRDRAERGDDGWSIEQLKREAAKHRINVCQLRPNLEGLLLRLMPENENLQPDAFTAEKQLRKAWPNYEKSIDARAIAAKLTLADLLRVARVDTELRTLLSTIGFKICTSQSMPAHQILRGQ